jgi:hypothetical protein
MAAEAASCDGVVVARRLCGFATEAKVAFSTPADSEEVGGGCLDRVRVASGGPPTRMARDDDVAVAVVVAVTVVVVVGPFAV